MTTLSPHRAMRAARATGATLALTAVGLLCTPRLLFAQATSSTAPVKAPIAARPADVASLDAIVGVLYEVISGPAGQKRDWDRFRTLFAPGARLIPTAVRPGQPARANVLTTEEYITLAAPGLEGGGFFEREIGRTTQQFGHVTHIFSAYDSKRTLADAAPFQRGINSIQLLDDGNRWWIVTIYWDAERPDNPIPAKYLGTGRP